MTFESDNTAPAAPEMLEALARCNGDMAAPYGNDAATPRLNDVFSDLFETRVAVFPLALGTAANGLLLSCLTPPWGAVFAHKAGHVLEDESTAPELYTGGARFVGVTGDRAMVDPSALEDTLAHWPKAVVHAPQPAALALTQATEQGAVYTPDAVAALTGVAARHGMRTMMDGARFANAIAHLGCAPGDVTWRAGVDALVFGVTKNGGLGAEAAILFDPTLGEEFAYRRKRAGHLISKMRFLSAQILASVEDGRWLDRAAHANAMAARLADGLVQAPGAALCHRPQANAVFARLDDACAGRLRAAGMGFLPWRTLGPDAYRFVTAWTTTAGQVDACIAAAQNPQSVQSG